MNKHDLSQPQPVDVDLDDEFDDEFDEDFENDFEDDPENNFGNLLGVADQDFAERPDPYDPRHGTVVNREERVGRNDPCPCGSGKKFKKCCGGPGKR